MNEKRGTWPGDAPVVITGMGLTSALGASAQETWRAVVEGKCGMGAMAAMESALPQGAQGGQAVELPAEFEPTLPREARYLRWTILSALRDAAMADALPCDGDRCAIVLGTTLHGMRAGGRFLRSGDYRELTQFTAGDVMCLAAAGLGFSGSTATTCSACSSSLGSIALGVTMLQTGQADIVIAGGYDAISEYVWAGFNSLRLVASGALRPFSRGRQGMKLGEGYGIVVLERAGDAHKRGAKVRATIAGWGESADAHHLTQPHPQGEGALRAMNAALERAGIEAAELDLIAAHATGTPDNDASEYAALKQLLGEKIRDVPVVCFKSHLGHTLGGAGAVELILSAMAIAEGVVPACANVRAEEVEFEGLWVTSDAPVKRSIRYALNTSLGFGGANTCVVLGKESAGSAAPRQGRSARRQREAWITGIGVVLPCAIGNDAFVVRVRAPAPTAWQQPPAALRDEEFEHLLNARRVRRMSAFVKATLAAATLACRDAALIDRADLLAETSAVLGTTHGSSGYCHDYYAQIVRDGVLAANPMLFAEGVPNVGAAQLSLMLGLKSACQSIIGTRTAGIDALRLAWLRVMSGDADRVIVAGAEERHATVEAGYESCGLRATGASCAPFTSASGFCPSAGAVSLVVESAESARARGATPYARIEGAGALSGDRETSPRTIARLLQSLGAHGRVLSSANGTWIDRAELTGIARAAPHAAIGCVYDATGEVFSATPLLGIAAAVMMRELPALAHPPAGRQELRWSGRGERADEFTALCTDYSGAAGAVKVRVMGERGLSCRGETADAKVAAE